MENEAIRCEYKQKKKKKKKESFVFNPSFRNGRRVNC